MAANIWAVVGGVTYQLPMEALLGTANQLLGMNAAATALQYKAATFDNATDQFAVPVGAVGAPSYTFTGQLTSGFYWSSGLALAISGAKVLGVSGSLAQWSINVQLLSKLLQEDFGADITAAATTDLGNATGNVLAVTNTSGDTVVTSLGGDSLPAGTEIETIFSITGGTITLTHNATSLILLGNSNISLSDGDVARWRKINDSSPYWRMVGFQRGLSATAFTAKGDLLVGEQVGSIIQAAVLARGNDGEVLKADSTQAKGLVWGAVASPPVRQTVLAAALTAAGYCNLVSAGAALNYNIAATTTPALLTFAQGFGAGGQQDAFTYLTADQTNQGSLVANNINYLHATRVNPSSVTWGSCLIPPQYGYTFDRTEGALLNFEGADTSTTFIDDFGNSWSAIGNAQIDTAQFKFGTSSLLCDGTGDGITTSNILTLGSSSWEMCGWVRINSFATNMSVFHFGNASDFGVLLRATTASRFSLYISSTGTSWDVSNATLSTNTFSTGTWYRIRIVFDALAGTYRVYVSNNGAAEVQEITVSSTAKVCTGTLFRLGIAPSGIESFNGWIDAFRFVRCATVTSTQTPSASAPSITDFPVHFFSVPEMKMYEVTAPSTTPAVNPTLSQVTRLFVGEADTGAGSVSAVRNYALRGEYRKSDALPGASTATAHTHNIGCIDISTIYALVNATAEGGYTPGQRAINPTSYYQSGTSELCASPIGSVTRNSLNVIHGSSSSGVLITHATNFSIIGLTPSFWRYELYVRRNW
jgi:hypothetical protein